MAGPIYLVRHSIAVPWSPEGDRGRALTDEGRARFERLLESLGAELKIERIVSSPYARALQTAELISERLGVPVEEARELAAGESSGPALLAFALSCGPGTAVVGHNPEITDAIHKIAGQAVPVPPGTIVAVEPGAPAPRMLWRREP